MKRKMFEIVAGRGIDLSPYIDLKKYKIVKLWTVYDEVAMWVSCKFNAETGKPVQTLEDLSLQHQKGVFIEEPVHDYDIKGDILDYASRVAEQGTKVKILIEYEELSLLESIRIRIKEERLKDKPEIEYDTWSEGYEYAMSSIESLIVDMIYEDSKTKK